MKGFVSRHRVTKEALQPCLIYLHVHLFGRAKAVSHGAALLRSDCVDLIGSENTMKGSEWPKKGSEWPRTGSGKVEERQ